MLGSDGIFQPGSSSWEQNKQGWSIPRKSLRWEDPINPTFPKVSFSIGKSGKSHVQAGIRGMELSGKMDPTGKKFLREMLGGKGSKNCGKKSTGSRNVGITWEKSLPKPQLCTRHEPGKLIYPGIFPEQGTALQGAAPTALPSHLQHSNYSWERAPRGAASHRKLRRLRSHPGSFQTTGIFREVSPAWG